MPESNQYTAQPAMEEHILVCLSASPTNARIIHTAAKMSEAFGGAFTALYVQMPSAAKLTDADRSRLRTNTALAEDLGAVVTTVYGDDVSYQIAEFARLSGVTKIVIGRSAVGRRHFWSKPTLTEKLIEMAPGLEIHIIPDPQTETKYRQTDNKLVQAFVPGLKDVLVTLAILVGVTAVGHLFYQLGFTESNIITVYILGVLLTSLFTKGYACGIIGAVLSVMLFNFFFTVPQLTFHAYAPGYPVTFGIMLAASVLTGTLASKLKDHAKLSAQAAFRTKILLETNQRLQKAQDEKDIVNITAGQLLKLLRRDVIAYIETDGRLRKGELFSAEQGANAEKFLSDREQAVAEWVYSNRTRAGATTEMYAQARCLYLPVSINSKVYGVFGIDIASAPMDAYENSVLLSILGECALAIENSRNAAEKEKAAVLAKNEQLRADLLRAISHDLRTPLTSIVGNASSLLEDYDKLDEETRRQTFLDIFDDSQWLIGLVENLLSITRFEEGRVSFKSSIYLIDEVIEEALHHVSRKSVEHVISVERRDELMLAQMDARLIVQVIVNIVDNAVKYTPPGSKISISACRDGEWIAVSIADDGPGIPDEIKPRVFEMFFTGDSSIADSRRSLGLGLALCRAIITAHGGTLTLEDNYPTGAVFTFTLPSEEVNFNE